MMISHIAGEVQAENLRHLALVKMAMCSIAHLPVQAL